MKSLYIDGEWVAAENGKTYTLKSPANEELIGEIADGGKKETQKAILAARDAGPTWKKMPAKERGILLKRAESILVSRAGEIARLITEENGKPLAEAKGEVLFSAGYLSWAAEEGRRLYGDVIPSPFAHKRLWTNLQPIGVVGAITPWNFPANMVVRKIAPALAAGCTVVLKPAENTPLTALAIAEVLHEAGIPPGVFNIVTAKDPRPVSEEFLTNPHVRMLTFTGSVEVGKLLMAQAAKQLKKLSLELGGNAPAIVFEDADLEKTIERVVAIKFLRVGGQSCICANRIYVHQEIYRDFKTKFLQRVQSLKVGQGFTEGVQIGPLISEHAREHLHNLVLSTQEKGGKILLGGHPLVVGDCAKGFFYAPTVIEGSQEEWPICQNEIFGPVANLLPFSNEEEVIERANKTEYGLAAYIYSQNLARVFRVSEALEYGFIGINDGEGYTHEIPIGGCKQSGMGREGGKEGLREYTETQSLILNMNH